MNIRKILEIYRTIAVVGLSTSSSRPSHSVSKYMQANGYRIIPINPNVREVLGERSYARLEDVPERIEIVDIFRRSNCVPDLMESAIRVGAKVVWLQEGVVHEEAAQRGRDAGLDVIMDRCVLKEHMMIHS